MGGKNPYLSGGQQGSDEYNKGKIGYYTDPGELMAHAKQYAVMYSRFYPGQAFDTDKMMALSSYDPKIERFFKGLQAAPGQSDIWGMDTTPYQQQLKTAGTQFMQMVQNFVQKRQQQKSPIEDLTDQMNQLTNQTPVQPTTTPGPQPGQKGQLQSQIDGLIADYKKNGGYDKLTAAVNQMIGQNPQMKDKIVRYFNTEFQKPSS